MIIGGPGSGKSTLARRLGGVLDLPVTHLDAVYWKPGWVFQKTEAVADRLAALYETDAWVIEGNYSDTWDHRLARADTLVVLDMSTPLRVWRCLCRTVTSHGKVRPDMAEGCPERIDLEFFRFVLTYALRRRGKALTLLRAAPGHVAGHHLRGPAAVVRFLDHARNRGGQRLEQINEISK